MTEAGVAFVLAGLFAYYGRPYKIKNREDAVRVVFAILVAGAFCWMGAQVLRASLMP